MTEFSPSAFLASHRKSSQFVTFEMMCAETDENENEDREEFLVNSIYIWI